MYILGRTQPLSAHPIHECLGLIRRLGFDGVEICLENPDLAPERLTEQQAKAIGARVAELGLRPHSVSYHKDYIYDDVQFELTRKAIRLTPHFGTNIFVFAGTSKRTRDAAEWDRMLDRTKALVDLAGECGVVLAQEFEPGFIVGSTAALLRLFEAVPSPHLAANLDLGHAFLTDPDSLASIRQLRGKIVHCHIEGMKAGVHRHLLPQEGDMDLSAYLSTLAEVGFGGGLALDLYLHDYQAVAPGCIAFIRGLLSRCAR